MKHLRERIAAAATRAGRTPEDILLVAVTKTVEPEKVREAYLSGITVFGENYIQEAREKIPLLQTEMLDAEWHLIGKLQSNKARYCPPLFSVVESIDSFSLAKEMAKATSKQGKTAQRVLVEVDLSETPGRAGISPDQALELCEQIAQLPELRLEGMMGISPLGSDPEEARPHFRRLRSLWERLPAECRKTLSMGMSGDFEIAIEEGATLVRIGTALFGARRSRPIIIP